VPSAVRMSASTCVAATRAPLRPACCVVFVG